MTEISQSYQNPLSLLWDKAYFQSLPLEPGVYFFLDEAGEPLYIGKANQLRKRLLSYACAKPGRVGEHILEMLEHVRGLRWELYPSGETALIREAELLRAVRPPYNLAGTDPIPYLYLGLRAETDLRETRETTTVEFRLTQRTVGEGFSMFGCFPHRGKTKAGYSALLRLLFIATCERDRFQLPAKLCRASPAYVYKMTVPRVWLAPLTSFLRGENTRLLKLLFEHLLSRETLSPVLYAPIQRDLATVQEFFEVGPKTSRRVFRSRAARTRTVSQSQMDRYVRATLLDAGPVGGRSK